MSYIKIHRGLLDSYSFANSNYLKIWIWLLLKANYKKTYYTIRVGDREMPIEINRGQLLFGRKSASSELCIGGSSIYRAIKKFEELGQINIKSNNYYSIITICKYDSYQGQDKESEQQENNKRTTSEQQANTYKEGLEIKEIKEIESSVAQKNDLSNSNLFRKPNIPDYKKVLEIFKIRGGSEEMAKRFFEKYEALNWYKDNTPIFNFEFLVNGYISTWKTNENKKQSKKENNPYLMTGTERVAYMKEQQEKNKTSSE